MCTDFTFVFMHMHLLYRKHEMVKKLVNNHIKLIKLVQPII